MNSIIIIFLLFNVTFISAWISSRPPVTARTQFSRDIQEITRSATCLAILNTSLRKVEAAQGAIKPSTLEETKSAVKDIQSILDDVNTIPTKADKKEFQEIADVLGGKKFQSFSDSCQILVRSDAVSADDKVALGTIKRYGTVADAIIMIGGIGAEIKAGGYKIADGGGGDKSQLIEDDSDDSEGDAPPVNVGEVKRYVKLAAGSLQDILRIGTPVLSK